MDFGEEKKEHWWTYAKETICGGGAVQYKYNYLLVFLLTFDFCMVAHFLFYTSCNFSISWWKNMIMISIPDTYKHYKRTLGKEKN